MLVERVMVLVNEKGDLVKKFPLMNKMLSFRQDELEVLQNHSDGGPAVVMCNIFSKHYQCCNK